MRAITAILALSVCTYALAQDNPAGVNTALEEPSLQQSFVEAAHVCLGVIADGEALADDPRLRSASSATRAAHPFGADEGLRELASRSDGQVTLRAPDARTCSVFAVGAPPTIAFDELASALLARGGFTEVEIRRQHEGRFQRTFRSDDGRMRVEMEGFLGNPDGQPSPNDLSMVHMGRRR